MTYDRSKSRYDATRDRVKFFSSPEEHLAWCKSLPAWASRFSGDRVSWAGCTGDEAMQRLEFGSKQYLAQAEALIEKMQQEGIFSHGQKIYETSVVGSFPCVPNALMGLPDTMYQLSETDMISTTTPVRIYVHIVVSAGINTTQIVNRGVAMLGLTMALKNIRPVELYALAIGDPRGRGRAHGIVTRIETNPIDLDRATFMLCDPGYMRQVSYGNMCWLDCEKHSGYISWPWGVHGIGEADAMSALLDLQDDDIYIPGAHLTNDLYYKDPVSWINNYLKKYSIEVQ